MNHRTLPAGLAAGGMALFILIMRLPAALEFLVPRHPGFFWFQMVMALGAYARFAALAGLLLLLSALALLLWDVYRVMDWRRNKARYRSAAVWLVLLPSLAGLFYAARWAVSVWFDLLMNVWFIPGGADAREPILAFLGVFWAGFFLSAAAAALAAWAAQGQRRQLLQVAGWAGCGLAPALALYVWAAANCDIRAQDLAAAAGLSRQPAGRETVLIFTEDKSRPDFAVQGMDLDWNEASLGQLEDYLARKPRSAFRRQAERGLWEGYARLQDVPRLRQALWAAERDGDALAWLMLAEHLSAAPPDALAANLLGRIADERRWRIGPQAAAILANAYAHLGMPETAARWRERFSSGAAIAAGMLPDLPAGGALRPGTVRGRISGTAGARVSLYARPDRTEPYSLNAGRLAASTQLDAKGGFSFAGLAAGNYYLVLSVSGHGLPENKEELVLRGHRGDISLSQQRPSMALPLISIQTGKPR
ncbi:MAG: carboxypeptidase-like regulatory domain-containing protein [Elusimicrobiota bacterium]|jgi:hypothetical protein